MLLKQSVVDAESGMGSSKL